MIFLQYCTLPVTMYFRGFRWDNCTLLSDRTKVYGLFSHHHYTSQCCNTEHLLRNSEKFFVLFNIADRLGNQKLDITAKLANSIKTVNKRRIWGKRSKPNAFLHFFEAERG